MAPQSNKDVTCLGLIFTSENCKSWMCHICNKLFTSEDELGEHASSHDMKTSKVFIPLLSQWLCNKPGLSVEIPAGKFTDNLWKRKVEVLNFDEDQDGTTTTSPGGALKVEDVGEVPMLDQAGLDMDAALMALYCGEKPQNTVSEEASTKSPKPVTASKTRLASKKDSKNDASKLTTPRKTPVTRRGRKSVQVEASVSDVTTDMPASSDLKRSKRRSKQTEDPDFVMEIKPVKRRRKKSPDQNIVETPEEIETPQKVKTVVKVEKDLSSKKQKFCCNICKWTSINHNRYHTHLKKHTLGDTIASCDHCGETLQKKSGFPMQGEGDAEGSTNVAVKGEVGADGSTSGASAEGDVEASEDILEEMAGKDMRGSKLNRKYWTPKCLFECKDCSWNTKIHFNYHRHMFTHRKNVAFSCDYCNKPLSANSGKSGFGQVKERCSICKAGPMHQSRLTAHMISEHQISASPASGKPLMSCDQCSYKTSKPAHLITHTHRCHDHPLPEGVEIPKRPEKPIREKKSPKKKTLKSLMCDKCGYVTNRSDLMKQHMLRHNPEDAELLHCDQCDFVTVASRGLTNHMKTHKPRLPCFFCQKGTTEQNAEQVLYSQDQYPIHLAETHNLEDVAFCEHCGEIYFDVDSLTKHLAEVHSKGNVATFYVCYECGVSVGSKDDLINHQISHEVGEEVSAEESAENDEGDAAVKTEQQGDSKDSASSKSGEKDTGSKKTGGNTAYKEFRQKLNELRNSSHIKEFPCTTCSVRFAELTELNQHLQDEHQVTNFKYQCKTCGHFDKSQGGLRKHVAKHSCVREVYVCNICGIEANRRWNLMRHKEKAHAGTNYSCSHCDYSTRSVPRISEHFRKIHLTEPPLDIENLTNPGQDKGASIRELLPQQRKEYDKKRLKEKYSTFKKICSECGKLIPANHMKTHMNLHTGYKPFRCHYDGCDFSSILSFQLADHIRRNHLGVGKPHKYYQCAYCPFQNNSCKNLEKHIRRCHTGEIHTDPNEELKGDSEPQEQILLGEAHLSVIDSTEVLEEVGKLGQVLAVDQSGEETREVHVELTSAEEVKRSVEHLEVSQEVPKDGTEMYMLVGDVATETVIDENYASTGQQFQFEGEKVIPGSEDGMQHIVLVCESQVESPNVT